MKQLSFKNKFSLKNKVIHFYENWILPPQNETLLELKKREFREKTKYLKPEIFYALSEEEKNGNNKIKIELRNDGYIVDLDKASINKIRNFHLTYNRHKGRYQYYNNDYNQMVYQTKYYYGDQEENLFLGDEYYKRKKWRKRSPFKRYTSYFILFFLFVYLHSFYYDRKHRKLREFYKKIYEDQYDFKDNMNVNTLVKIGVEDSFEEIFLSSLIEGYKCSIVLRSEEEDCIKIIAEILQEFKKNVSDPHFKFCLIILLSENYYNENIQSLIEKFNTQVYDGIKTISFLCYDYRKEDLKEKQLYYFMPESLSIIDKNINGYWGTKCTSKKAEINKYHFKIKLGNLSRDEALKLKKENYLNI